MVRIYVTDFKKVHERVPFLHFKQSEAEDFVPCISCSRCVERREIERH